MPFAHLYIGAPLHRECRNRRGGRYCLYRWHGDNPVTFTQYLKHTMEHGHANDRADNFLLGGVLVSGASVYGFPHLAAGTREIPALKI